MKILNPYLSFNGNCEAAFNFYKTVFGGEFAVVVRYKDIPPGGPAIPESAKEKIMHMVLPISKETMLLGADALKEFPYTPLATKDITLSVDVHEEADAKRIFKQLAEGGKVVIPLEKTAWAMLYGLCTDKFGITWIISHGEEKVVECQ